MMKVKQKFHNNKKLFLLIFISAVLLFGIWYGMVQRGADDTDSGEIDIAAEVNGIQIRRQEVEEELARTKHFYAWAKDAQDDSVLESDVTERLIEKQLIEEYAENKRILVNGDEVTMRFNATATTQGGETELLKRIHAMYRMNKDDYFIKIREDILREKVQQSVGKPLAEWLKEQKNKASLKQF